MLEQIDIPRAQRLYPVRLVRSGLAGCLEQLCDDLRIGLSIKAYVVESTSIPYLLTNGRDDSPAPSARCQEDGSVDIEENEFGHP
jgi:hypothetical protein